MFTRRGFLKSSIIAFVVVLGVNPSFAQQVAAQKANSAPTLGVNMLSLGDAKDIEARFQRMKSLGITEARLDWRWDAVEKTKGTYDWSAMDNLVALAKKHNVTLFPIVHYAPDWALSHAKKPDGIYEMAPKEEAFADYAKFLAASIDRYGSIKNWQVWNEPNNKDFWGPKPDTDAFIKLMTTVNNALGERRKKITLVHAGLSKADHTYLWQLWEKDKDYGRLFDVMAVHPYFFNPKGGVRKVDEVGANDASYAAMGFIGSADDTGFLDYLHNIQLFMSMKEGAVQSNRKPPIWVTEIGFMAGDKNKNPWAVSEEEQASLTRQTLERIQTKHGMKPFGIGARGDLPTGVEKVYWFMLDGVVLPGTPEGAGDFGLFRPDGTKRPAADVVKEYIANTKAEAKAIAK